MIGVRAAPFPNRPNLPLLQHLSVSSLASRRVSGCRHADLNQPLCRIAAVASPLVALIATDRTMSSDASNKKASRFLTVPEVADELGVSTKHVRRAIDRGDLPIHRFGRAVRVARADLEQFINCHRS